MWHLSFAAANLVLSVATAVAFSSKLSRGWVKLKRSRAGASADKEVWVQVPLRNRRKPLINFNSWERGISFVWTEDDTQGDVDGCALGMLLGSPSCTSWVYCSFAGLPLAFCPWWAANFLSVSFPNDWRRIFVKNWGNLFSHSAADWIWALSMWSSTPKSNVVDFESGVMKSTGLL